MLDSQSMVPPSSSFTMPDLRLGGIRYTRDRFVEREAVAWHFTPDGTFQRGVPREDQEEYDSVKARIYEVGLVEGGRYKGHVLERWDVNSDRVTPNAAPVTNRYHYYFLRTSSTLVHLPKMAKGARVDALWPKGAKGEEVLTFLRQKWDTALTHDQKFAVAELAPEKTFSVPGEGTFVAGAAGESITATESRLGAPVALASLPKGKEVYRVPGDWIVCVYPDGLAVHLKKQ